MSIEKFRGPRYASEGSFLIELLVAIGVLSIMVFTILQYQWEIKSLQIDANRRLIALNYGREAVEHALKGAYGQKTEVISKGGYTITVNRKKLGLAGGMVIEGYGLVRSFYKVIITVGWSAISGQKRTLALMTGYADEGG